MGNLIFGLANINMPEETTNTPPAEGTPITPEVPTETSAPQPEPTPEPTPEPLAEEPKEEKEEKNWIGGHTL